ncbi:type IV toxin-antitoxin system AbiEi family antitoxin domain-containing protein [Sedimentisphaera salicampi]|uniref:AbiEi antitoxin N-terminal domain-containing protein n=1 Tax=Sedimentisphaera salicampi TaxID=1941349 RepID=A0A1W6LNZ7_9BACT|nr:type IV toxin-antitoxin system AbiEi family antitoxin domain-containing protein [Sedimentisphaera salicampi]ARN57471.1 hypothetical protein STSP1_01881 [Sedimentisphaera salicampi]
MGIKAQKLIENLRQYGMLKTGEIVELGISKEYLRKLTVQGTVERVSRGLYTLPNNDYSPMQSIAEVSKQVPKGVICLLSALRFHGFTTQNPFEVWIAIENRSRKPEIKASAKVRYVRFSQRAFTDGIQEKRIDQLKVRVYSPAKTVADCFKYRNKIGLDTALEALREGWREKRFTMDELWKYAKVCRVSNVMQPYLESITAL